MPSNNYVLIMAGGVGSRFWPKSRNNFPKQFIHILGIGKSLLQLTYRRFLKLCPAENIYILTNSQYSDLIREQLPGIDTANITSEPSRNNTAPCITYASFKIAAINPEANIVVAPSDHFIMYEEIFVQKLQQALSYSQQNDALVTLGIFPTRPDTGYGYINNQQENKDGIHPVIRFTEKPDMEKHRSSWPAVLTCGMREFSSGEPKPFYRLWHCMPRMFILYLKKVYRCTIPPGRKHLSRNITRNRLISPSTMPSWKGPVIFIPCQQISAGPI